MNKNDREYKREREVAESLATIQEARESVEALVRQYDEWIDEAAELGEDAYSDQLIEDQIELEEFGRNLAFIEVQIKKEAISARALNKLNTLSRVTSCCKTWLKKGADLKKIGKQMSSLREMLDTSKSSLKDLRRELAKGGKDDTYSKLFGERKSTDPDMAKKIAAKKQAREARLAAKIEVGTSRPVASGIDKGAASPAATDIDAITDIIDEERKRK